MIGLLDLLLLVSEKVVLLIIEMGLFGMVVKLIMVVCMFKEMFVSRVKSSVIGFFMENFLWIEGENLLVEDIDVGIYVIFILGDVSVWFLYELW